MTSSLYFELLGPPRLVVDGTPRAIRSKNLSIILATLLIRSGSLVTVDELIGEVWGQPPRRARDAVYVYISKLREHLGDRSPSGPIRSQFPGYVMHVTGRQLDVQLFRRHRIDGHLSMANGDFESAARSLRTGLSLHRGSLLGGAYFGPILSSFDLWLQQSHTDCIELTAWSLLSAGLYHETIDFLSHHLPQNPLNEILYQQQMLAFFLTRHRAQALGAFSCARRNLSDKLGVEPGGDLLKTQEIVLTDDVGRAKRAIASAVASRVSSLRQSGELRPLLSSASR
jgi:DNA-binding SARP family transcriptional activator